MAEIEWVTNNGPSARFRSVCQVPVHRPGSSPSAMFQPVGQVPVHRPGGRQRPLSRNFRPSGAGPRHYWRRSPGCLAQVRKKVGDLRRWKAWAIDWRSRTLREKQTCSAWPGDLRRKKGDLRHQQKAPAPEEGRTCSGRGGGGTCAGRRADLLRKRPGDLRHSPGLWV